MTQSNKGVYAEGKKESTMSDASRAPSLPGHAVDRTDKLHGRNDVPELIRIDTSAGTDKRIEQTGNNKICYSD